MTIAIRFVLATLLASLFASVVSAQPTPPAIAARSWLLLDVTSGQVLASNQPDLKIEPASLTKLMTAYLAFTALREKRLTLEQRPPVSKAAWKAIGSRMFVDPAQPATVDELLHGMIIQ
ncbi:MAG: serine hydrolase, partial [Quisquiliibacterium sp.]